MTENRIRVNAKSNMKGVWSLDVTVEATGEDIISFDVDVLKVIQEKEKEFRADGRVMAGDSNE